MNSNELNVLTNSLYQIMGRDMYKSLRSEPNLLQDLSKVWNTMKSIITKQDQSQIVKGIDPTSNYLFFECPLYDVLSFRGIVLYEEYVEKVPSNEKYIMSYNRFDKFCEEYGDALPSHFSWVNLFPDSKGKDWNQYFKDLMDGVGDEVLTAAQWNSFWENIISKSRQNLVLKPLECRFIPISEISGLVSSVSLEYSTDRRAYVNVPDFKGYKLAPGQKTYPIEFSIVCGIACQQLYDSIVGNWNLDKDEMTLSMNVPNYLFPTILN